MKFLCLCYYDQSKSEGWTKADIDAIERECPPHDAALRKSGHLSLVGSLGFPNSASTIRPGNRTPSVSAGPFLETPEPLGAFFIVEARDMDEAVAVASLHPGAHLGRYFGGGIEVRPCESLEQI